MTSPVGAFFDFWGDGFGAHPENDVTDYLISVDWQRGGAPEVTGAAQAGSCTLVLKNPAGRFSPDNASGPLYGKLHDGIRFWFGANEDGTLNDKGATVRGRFAGRISENGVLPVPGAGSATPTAEIVIEDPLAWYARTMVHLDHDCSPPSPPPASWFVTTGYGGADTPETELWASDDGVTFHQVLSSAALGAGTLLTYNNYLAAVPPTEARHAFWQLRYSHSDGRSGLQFYPGVNYQGQYLLDYAFCRNYKGESGVTPSSSGVSPGDFYLGIGGYGYWYQTSPGVWAFGKQSLWGSKTWTTGQIGSTVPPGFFDADGTSFLSPRMDSAGSATGQFGVGAGVISAPYTEAAQWTVAL